MIYESVRPDVAYIILTILAQLNTFHAQYCNVAVFSFGCESLINGISVWKSHPSLHPIINCAAQKCSNSEKLISNWAMNKLLPNFICAGNRYGIGQGLFH